MRLVYTERAFADIDLTMEWYEKQRAGLGHEFLDCLETTITSILDHPEIYPVKYKNIRSGSIRRFPFSVFYTAKDQGIIVHAVFDNRQSPDKNP